MIHAKDSKDSNSDWPILWFIVRLQLCLSATGLSLLIFGSVGGGAAASPKLFLAAVAFMICGFVSAVTLRKGTFSARVVAICWHAIFLGFVWWRFAQTPGTLKSSSMWEATVWASGASVIYLAATALRRMNVAPRSDALDEAAARRQ